MVLQWMFSPSLVLFPHFFSGFGVRGCPRGWWGPKTIARISKRGQRCAIEAKDGQPCGYTSFSNYSCDGN
eukprot:1287418-Amphidinium_carterae.1